MDPDSDEVVFDLPEHFRIYKSGRIDRFHRPVLVAAGVDDEASGVATKDVVLDAATGLTVRLFLPQRQERPSGKKLPVLVFFHGGGFIIESAKSAMYHNYLTSLAAAAGVLGVSVDYRLAPEHRLPAAFDDGASCMRWLRDQSVNAAEANAWLTEAADFGRVFVTGDSAGGTIAHHLAVRAGSAAAEPGGTTTADPVTVLGYVLMMPFFGGVRRTPSEAECPAEAFPNLDLVDRFWRLSLPAGATRDHPAANPFGPDSPDLGSVDLRPVLVVAGGLDLIRDRTVDYAERLAAMGKPVELAEFAGKVHGFYLHEPGSEATGELIQAVARFVDGCVAATEAAAAAA